MDKEQELFRLVEKRRRKDVLPGYKRLADYGNGKFDCDFVSPYSKGACNYDADVMIMLQDWSSDDALQRSSGPSELGRDRMLPTSKNLESFLETSLGLEVHETYATNLFPFIKAGGLSSRIPFVDFVQAAVEFGLPQIRIVAPRLVVCLGKNTFNALRVAAGLTRCRNMASAIESPFDIEFEGRKVAIWAQAHTGARGQQNRNKGDARRTSEDWQTMSRAVDLNASR